MPVHNLDTIRTMFPNCVITVNDNGETVIYTHMFQKDNKLIPMDTCQCCQWRPVRQGMELCVQCDRELDEQMERLAYQYEMDEEWQDEPYK